MSRLGFIFWARISLLILASQPFVCRGTKQPKAAFSTDPSLLSQQVDSTICSQKCEGSIRSSRPSPQIY